MTRTSSTWFGEEVVEVKRGELKRIEKTSVGEEKEGRKTAFVCMMERPGQVDGAERGGTIGGTRVGEYLSAGRC